MAASTARKRTTTWRDEGQSYAAPSAPIAPPRRPARVSGIGSATARHPSRRTPTVPNVFTSKASKSWSTVVVDVGLPDVTHASMFPETRRSSPSEGPRTASFAHVPCRRVPECARASTMYRPPRGESAQANVRSRTRAASGSARAAEPPASAAKASIGELPARARAAESDASLASARSGERARDGEHRLDSRAHPFAVNSRALPESDTSAYASGLPASVLTASFASRAGAFVARKIRARSRNAADPLHGRAEPNEQTSRHGTVDRRHRLGRSRRRAGRRSSAGPRAFDGLALLAVDPEGATFEHREALSSRGRPSSLSTAFRH